MAQATSDYYAEAETVSSLVLTNPNSVVLDTDSLLNTRKPVALQEVKSTSLHLIGQALKKALNLLMVSVLIDEFDLCITRLQKPNADVSHPSEDWVIFRTRERRRDF